jgi:hypothetical protein
LGIRLPFLWVWRIEKLSLNAKLPLSYVEYLGKIKQIGKERHKPGNPKENKNFRLGYEF